VHKGQRINQHPKFQFTHGSVSCPQFIAVIYSIKGWLWSHYDVIVWCLHRKELGLFQISSSSHADICRHVRQSSTLTVVWRVTLVGVNETIADSPVLFIIVVARPCCTLVTGVRTSLTRRVFPQTLARNATQVRPVGFNPIIHLLLWQHRLHTIQIYSQHQKHRLSRVCRKHCNVWCD